MKTCLIFSLAAMLLAGNISCGKANKAEEAEISEPAPAKEVPAKAFKYDVTADKSVMKWTGSKPTGSHSGTIRIAEGSLHIKNDTLQTGLFKIDMNSIAVTDPKTGPDKTNLENHLKGIDKEGNGGHFFNVIKYPHAEFAITAATAKGEKTVIEGNLTIKDITKNIKFPARITISDSLVTLMSDKFTINRKLWDIGFSSQAGVEKLGDQYIDDNIEIEVNLQARR